MSYYTRYSGEVLHGASERSVAKEISNLNYFKNNFLLGDYDTIDGVIAFDWIVWNSCIKDMEKISRKFPEALIYIHGDGEAPGDLWNAYFKNGKSVIYPGKIVYPEFNEKDLK